MTITLEQLNTAPQAQAAQMLLGLYEHSDWIAEKALSQRPFRSLAQLKHAMVRVLQGAFTAAFGAGRFTLGALVSLLVTVADLSLLNIGAAFWGLVAGFLVSWWMERQDFAARPPAG